MIENIKDLNNSELEELIRNLEQKKINLEIKSNSKKNLINSLSGALGNSKFPLYETKLSKSMTSYGRYYIKSIIKRLNDYLMKTYEYNDEALIYTHTDSIFLNLDPYIKTLEDNLDDKEIEIALRKKSEDLLKIIEAQFMFANKMFNSNENVLKMKLDGIFKHGIWCSSSNYFISNMKNEIKIVGLSLAKSSTPKFSSDKLKDILSVFLKDNIIDIKNYIIKAKEDFYKQDIINLAFTENVNNIYNGFVDHKDKINILDELLLLKGLMSYNKDDYDMKIIQNNFALLNNLIYTKEIDLNKFKSILNKTIEFLSINNNNILNKINLIYKMIDNFNNIYISALFKPNFVFKKGIRYNTQGAIIYNKYIKDNNLPLKPIYNNEKIKFIFLKKDNPFNSNVISFKTNEDIEILKLENFIDYELQFEKSFIKPLEQITKTLNIDINFYKKGQNNYDYFNSLF